jgi:hypothetical protein
MLLAMTNRWLRFVIAVLAITSALAAGYRIHQQEQSLAASTAAAAAVDRAADTARETVAELKAALHAYVAEGQGRAFWTSRAALLIDRLHTSVVEIDAPAAAAGVPLTETLDLVDRVQAAEQRAREYVTRGEALMAGDVIFTEARDLLDAIRLQVARAHAALADRAEADQAAVRRQQLLLGLGAAGVLAFATLLLVVPPRPREAPASPARPVAAPALEEDEYGSSARLVSRVPLTAADRTAASRAASASAAHAGAPTGTASLAPGGSSASGTASSSAPPAPPVSLREAAAICTDLGRASQAVEIAALLRRAADVLGASGTVVWIASPGGHELYPAASAGYDERLLARIGSIRRDAINVTAAAFREATPKTSAATASAPAALAVPLLTPLGAVGVLSAEVRAVPEVDDARLAIATIFAAQLASLVGSIDASEPAQAEAGDNASPASAPAQASRVQQA